MRCSTDMNTMMVVALENILNFTKILLIKISMSQIAKFQISYRVGFVNLIFLHKILFNLLSKIASNHQ